MLQRIEKVLKNTGGQTDFTRTALPRQVNTTFNNGREYMLLPFSLITALHDRFMFSSKPPTLGFTGSVIKSWGGELNFYFITQKTGTYVWQVIAPFTVVREGNLGLRFLIGLILAQYKS